jgi:hypothetical protein
MAEAPVAEPVEDIAAAEEPTDEMADPPPPWLQEDSRTVSDTTDTQEIYPIPDELKLAARAATGDMPEATDDDEVFRWLEGLAARQGADESELATPEDMRTTETPASIAPEEELIADDSQAIPEEPEQGLDWLEQLANDRGLDVEVEPSSDMSRMPAPTETEEAEEPLPAPEPSAEAPAWLQEMQAEAATEAEPKDEAAPVEAAPPAPPQTPIETPAAVDQPEMETEAPAWLQDMAEDPEQMGEEDSSFADFAAQLDAQPAEVTEEPAEAAEVIPEPDLPQSELDWLSADESEAVESQAEEELSAPDWLNRMADDSQETLTSPQVMMEEQAGEPTPAAEAEAVQPDAPEEEPAPQQAAAEEPVVQSTAPEEPAPQPVEPTPELAEEIAAEVKDFWAADDEPEEGAPEPVTVESPAPTETGSPLETAHLGLDHGDIEGAVAIYDGLIQEGQELDGIIAKITEVLTQDPNQALLWQTLGDAYMNNDQINEAIQAYQKGTEVA